MWWTDNYGVGLFAFGFGLTTTSGGVVIWTPWRAFGVGPDGFWTRTIPDFS